MTDRHLDLVLAYFEAIYWRKVENGALQPTCKGDAVFRQKGYWAAKNPGQQTSRDRYVQTGLDKEISGLEAALARLGFGAAYCAGIRQRVLRGRTDPHSLHLYKAALARTVTAKQNKREAEAPAAQTHFSHENLKAEADPK